MALAEANTSTGWVAAHANICAGIIYASPDPKFRVWPARRACLVRVAAEHPRRICHPYAVLRRDHAHYDAAGVGRLRCGIDRLTF